MNATSFFRVMLFFFVGSLLYVSCKRESKAGPETADLLLGRWEIREATRNGRPTESLDQLFFEFYQEGKMRTNLSGATEEAGYELDGKQLKQRNSQIETDYAIEEIGDSTLTLTTNISNYSFRFRLARTVMEE